MIDVLENLLISLQAKRESVTVITNKTPIELQLKPETKTERMKRLFGRSAKYYGKLEDWHIICSKCGEKIVLKKNRCPNCDKIL